MDAGGSIPLFLLLGLCFLASFFFSASEMALVAMNRIRVGNLADDGHVRAKRAMFIADHFEQALTTILVGNNIANIGAASIATLLSTRLWGVGSVAVTAVALTAFVFFFCEMLPKSLAKRRSEPFVLFCAPILIFLMRVLKPIAFLFTAWSGWVKRKFSRGEAPSYTEEELQDIVETIEDEGVLEPEERQLVLSAFGFCRVQAKDILIPVDRVVSLSLSASEAEVQRVLHEHNLSRFPVYDARRTHIIGMLQANRFYEARLEGTYSGLYPLLRPIKSYPEDIHIDALMTDMNARRSHMALIHGEGGKAIGIVTMEDILEELVGEIYDEDDVLPAGSMEEVSAG